MYAYDYSVSRDSKNGSVSGRRLLSELRTLAFSDVLANLHVQGDDLRVQFSRKLTAAEKKKLDGAIAAHDGAASETLDERRGAKLAELPPGQYEGQRTFAIDGRKVGEEKGQGTGVPVYWSGGAWRRLSDDKPVVA